MQAGSVAGDSTPFHLLALLSRLSLPPLQSNLPPAPTTPHQPPKLLPPPPQLSPALPATMSPARGMARTFCTRLCPSGCPPLTTSPPAPSVPALLTTQAQQTHTSPHRSSSGQDSDSKPRPPSTSATLPLQMSHESAMLPRLPNKPPQVWGPDPASFSTTTHLDGQQWDKLDQTGTRGGRTGSAQPEPDTRAGMDLPAHLGQGHQTTPTIHRRPVILPLAVSKTHQKPPLP